MTGMSCTAVAVEHERRLTADPHHVFRKLDDHRAQTSHALGLGQFLAARLQFVEGAAGAVDVAKAVIEKDRRDRLVDEVGRTGPVGPRDGAIVATSGHHDERGVAQSCMFAKIAAGGEPVHRSHDDIHQDDVRVMAFGEFEGL
ncbi:MAG: hypothetical protein R3C97_06835 [Geminicoccaceae bacterium]